MEVATIYPRDTGAKRNFPSANKKAHKFWISRFTAADMSYVVLILVSRMRESPTLAKDERLYEESSEAQSQWRRWRRFQIPRTPKAAAASRPKAHASPRIRFPSSFPEFE
jgi:hypothetical protein